MFTEAKIDFAIGFAREDHLPYREMASRQAGITTINNTVPSGHKRGRMHHRNPCRITSGILSLATIVILMPAGARAAQVSCETFNECTVGVCLEDGTCEANPGNNGASCDTFNTCTVGICADSECQESPANNGTACETFDYCVQKDGTCSAGECVAPLLATGAPCRADVLGPCFTGSCTNVGPIAFCTPESKCGSFDNSCEFDCNIVTGACESYPTHICDTACTTATCVPGEEFEYTCTNPVNRPNSTPCEDGSTCTANDQCDSGDCIGESGSTGQECGNGSVEAPEECDSGDTEFSQGESCDELCTLVPCGKPTNSTGELPKASDALFTLKAAVKSVTCSLLVCDVNDSGSVTASDALNTLKKAVGSEVTLDCPLGGGGGS